MLLAEVKILFQRLKTFPFLIILFENTDGTRTVPVLIYKSRGLEEPLEEKTSTLKKATFGQKTD
jgi:hypothetical protein